MFTLTINTDGAAFEDLPQAEVARILRELAERVGYGSDDDGSTVRDSNGNTVGEWTLAPAAEDDEPQADEAAVRAKFNHLAGKTFTNDEGWELIELAAGVYATGDYVSWDGMHDAIVEPLDDEWTTVRLRVLSVEDLIAAVESSSISR
ncbi:hypothetical protein I5G67_gp083 [Mycobacterium phage Aminay]|uniref:Uncharacterized protein n=1 Tax=Mycobacterium phage Aminay TaxID=2250291 RepID=A0A345KV67_9CAUD|nr:hypothetical protein I5G67_gp083 [Mycobacterium phage Aminay]AXH46919.1 hypothetical protein SEA_AMINAY_83 [Mycobacterium phage Aminay]